MAGGDSSGGDFEVGTWKLVLFFLLILAVVWSSPSLLYSPMLIHKEIELVYKS